MKQKLAIDMVRFFIKYVFLLAPIAVGYVLYEVLNLSLFWVLSFYFFVLSRSVFEVFENINEIKELKEEEGRQWKSMLSKRSSL